MGRRHPAVPRRMPPMRDFATGPASRATAEGGTLIVIPALNEAASIGEVVAAAQRALPHAIVVVVDDGSTDDTAALASAAGAEVLRLPFNCGIGTAVQAGLRFAVARRAALVVRLDADGQHDAGDVAALVSAIEGGADYAIGSRFCGARRAGYRSSFTRRLGIRWFAAVLRLVGARAITDPTSGFFAANDRAAAFLATHYASDYPEVDAVVRLARSGFRLVEVPVAMHERAGGISSIGGTAAMVYMVKVTVSIVVGWLDTTRRSSRQA
jgi:glycosyltransferase involved in cell wall biosynthesis